VHMMSMQEVLERCEAGEDFTPDSLFACREYIKMKGMPEAVGPRPEPVITK
jgi:hypothetical protein